jgi:hypothetical protein
MYGKLPLSLRNTHSPPSFLRRERRIGIKEKYKE